MLTNKCPIYYGKWMLFKEKIVFNNFFKLFGKRVQIFFLISKLGYRKFSHC